MPIDIAKQVEQEDAWGIITRRAIRGIAVGNQRSDEWKIDKGSYHSSVSALDVSIGQNFNESFFKSVGWKQKHIWERLLMGQRNINIDFIEFFAYIANGEFSKGVHQTPHDPASGS